MLRPALLGQSAALAMLRMQGLYGRAMPASERQSQLESLVAAWESRAPVAQLARELRVSARSPGSCSASGGELWLTLAAAESPRPVSPHPNQPAALEAR